MKPKPKRNLTLPWTPQREKASGNHLLPRKQATLNFPLIYAVFISQSHFDFVFPRVLDQFFELADLVLVNDTCSQS